MESRFREGPDSQLGHGSTDNLHDNAGSFAGHNSAESAPIARTTSAGVPVGRSAVGDAGATAPGAAQQGAEGAAAAPEPGAGAGATTPAVVGTPFYKTRMFMVSQIIAALVGIGLLFVILYPVVGAIAQHVVNVSVLNVDNAAIIQPSNGSFTLGMIGSVSHTGIFSAKIMFPEPLNVYWVNGGEEVPLGSFGLAPLSAKNKRAYINQTAEFTIVDQDAFGRFAAAMITSEQFTWRLKSNQLAARALRFPVSKGLKFQKDITLNGIDNFNEAICPNATFVILNFEFSKYIHMQSAFKIEISY